MSVAQCLLGGVSVTTYLSLTTVCPSFQPPLGLTSPCRPLLSVLMRESGGTDLCRG